MKSKYVNRMLILCLFLMFFMTLTTIGRPDLNLSTADDITDPAGDMIEIDGNAKTWKPTDLHTEIDIDTMIHSGQNFTITLHETVLTTSSYMYYFMIYEDIDDPSTIYTVMFYSTMSGFFSNPNGQYWTTSGWGSMPGAVTVGTISGDEFEIGIPSSALTLETSHNWLFMSMYNGANNMSYMDICPDSLRSRFLGLFSGPSGDKISGYELPVLIGITAMFSVIFVYMYKKRIKK